MKYKVGDIISFKFNGKFQLEKIMEINDNFYTIKVIYCNEQQDKYCTYACDRMNVDNNLCVKKSSKLERALFLDI